MPQQNLSGAFAVTKKKTVSKRGIPESLLDAISQEPDRFCLGAKNNKMVVDFPSFVSELKKAMQGNNASPYLFQDLDMELLRILFRSRAIRITIEHNIGKDEADKLYKKEEQSSLPSIVPSTTAPPQPPAISVNGYKRNGLAIKPYIRHRYPSLTGGQKNFIRQRKFKNKTAMQITNEYRLHYNDYSRSDSSLTTHIYRIK